MIIKELPKLESLKCSIFIILYVYRNVLITYVNCSILINNFKIYNSNDDSNLSLNKLEEWKIDCKNYICVVEEIIKYIQFK